MADSPLNNLPDFSLVSESTSFEPTYYPERVKPTRERNINRQDGLCEGEEVNDNGGKNHDLHVRGFLLESEKNTFWEVLDDGSEFEMVAMPWSGFVYVKSGNLEGPKGVDNREREWVYEYTLKFVAAGSGTETGNGIIERGG
jgi:hypothetical protein